ncbi:MAG: Ig-like domain-containing protein, partial [Gemmatimonadetes bacterium]|nr:Ig-like domain-containing protein [Gemmatimonadota bacterium]
ADSGPDVEFVTVSPASRTVTVGEQTTLTASARDEQGVLIEDRQFRWSSLEPGIATVAGGVVTGVARGTARIVAELGGKADTAEVTVVQVAGNCVSAGGTPELPLGGTYTVSGAAASVVCLSGAEGGAEYTLISHFGSESTTATTTLRFDPVGVSPAIGPPNPSVSFSTSASAQAAGGDGGFHLRLNERAVPGLTARVAAARRAYAGTRSGARMSTAQQSAPAVGTLLQLNVGLEFCTKPDYRTGRIVAVSNRALVVADTANPVNGFTDADYQHIAATFDTLVYPINAAAFGAPADVDGNGRSLIFYTRAVNELTPPNAGFVVGGFFYGRDLFPQKDDPNFGGACAGSNLAEMFYMLVPDPTGVVNGNARSTNYVRGSTVGVLAHEFQHLISASRRLYLVPGVDGTDWSEDAWLNEGLSHISEELLFYHRTARQPRSNIGGEALSGALRAPFLEFQDANLARFGEWLKQPEQNSTHDAANNDEADLATRGAAWAFLRYAADRRNGDDNALWHALVNNSTVGFQNLRQRLGAEPVQWMRDWVVSVYADDAVPNVPAVFTQPSWNFRSLYTADVGKYPLLTRPLNSGQPASVTLVSGGASYLRAAVAGGRKASVTVASGAALPATLSVTVVRTK